MDIIIDFYNSLDNLNLIIFWGIIIVIILLLMLSTALINKNKRLKKMINKGKIYEEEDEQLPLKEEDIVEETLPTTKSEIDIPKEQNIINDTPKIEEQPNQLQTENHFKAEEHVIEYNNELFALPNLKKADEYVEEQVKYDEPLSAPKKEINMPTGPYQRNVLREMSLSQTSPIGIVKNNKNKEDDNAKELQDSLNIEETKELEIEPPKIKEPEKKETKIDNLFISNGFNIEKQTSKLLPVIREVPRKNTQKEQEIIKEKLEKNNSIVKEEILNSLLYKTPRKTTIGEQDNNTKYLEKVKEKLAASEVPEDIDRTDYELQQEEEAIISYKELMEKKDSIKMVDEEDAVISIDELMAKNAKEEKKKLYNLTADEENDQFINELKNFRNDL